MKRWLKHFFGDVGSKVAFLRGILRALVGHVGAKMANKMGKMANMRGKMGARRRKWLCD